MRSACLSPHILIDSIVWNWTDVHGFSGGEKEERRSALAQHKDGNTQLSIYIPQDKQRFRPIERLQGLAEKRDRNTNYLVVQAILEYLDMEEDGESAIKEQKGEENNVPATDSNIHEASEAHSLQDRTETNARRTLIKASLPVNDEALRPTLLSRLRLFASDMWLRVRRIFDKDGVPEAVPPIDETEEAIPVASPRGIIIDHPAQPFPRRICQPNGRMRTTNDYLAPYTEYRIGRLPDPRNESPDAILSVICEIVKAEGPITVKRLTKTYSNSAGLRRVGRVLQAQYAKAITRGKRSARFRSLQFAIENGWEQTVLYIPNCSSSTPRVLGPRADLYEVPLPELGFHIRLSRKLFTAGGALSLQLAGLSKDGLLRNTLQMYGGKKLSSKARKYLEAAEKSRYGPDMHNRELTDEERKYARSVPQGSGDLR